MSAKEIPATEVEYPRIYHYTSLEGARGILQSQTLWATKYNCLNDSSEIVHFKNKLPELLRPGIEALFNRQEKRHPFFKFGMAAEIETMIDSLYKATGSEIYITSFCGEHEDEYARQNGLLSQWRGYGSDGGCILIFDTAGLLDMLKRERERHDGTGLIADVVYDHEHEKFAFEFEECIADISNYVATLVKQRTFQPHLKKFDADADKVLPSWLNCISRYKHRAFEEEKEIRMVVFTMILTDEARKKYVPEGSVIKPQWERCTTARDGQQREHMILFAGSGQRLPVQRIIVGPHREKQRRADELRDFLTKHQLDIPVFVSETPYV